MSKKILFLVRGDKVSLPKYPSFKSGSKGYYTAVFHFSEEWKGLIPHITISENGKKRADEVIIDKTFKIAVTESGTMRVGVYGLDTEGNKCISCNEVLFEVQKGSYENSPVFPSDIWEGYQITVLGCVERAEAAAKKAEAAAENSNGSNGSADFSNLSVSAVSGTEAAANMIETEEGFELQFVLPKGERGEQGLPGLPGEKGKDGEDGKSFTYDDMTEDQKADLLKDVYNKETVDKKIKEGQQPLAFTVHCNVYSDGKISIENFEDREKIKEAFESGRMVVAHMQIAFLNENENPMRIEMASLIATSPYTFFGVADSNKHVFVVDSGFEWVCDIKDIANKDYVSKSIGDIEASLENIIAKYNLGGDVI